MYLCDNALVETYYVPILEIPINKGANSDKLKTFEKRKYTSTKNTHIEKWTW